MSSHPIKPQRTTLRASLALLPALAIALVAIGCGDSGASGSASGGKLDIVGYSTPESVYEESLEPSFQATRAGADAAFSNSFGASGDQSRAVEAGQPASLVHFSQAGDMERLVEAGKVAPSWDKGKYKGIGQDSVVVIVTRKGNPKGIHSFEDLLSGDVDVITPNPFSSGSARWNIMALYGAELHNGKSPAQALGSVKALLENTIVQPGSGRDALAAFAQGEGDVLLSYENEAIKAQSEGEDIDYVIPDSTILIQTPIAVTTDAPASAQAFLDFIWSREGQKIWAENGYRPVNKDLVDPRRFPAPADLFTIDEFGGWAQVNDEFFDDTTGKIAEIERELGVSTSG